MTWTLEYDNDLKVVMLMYLGKANGADISEAAAARIDMGKQKSTTKYLIDTREVESDNSAIMDIYDIPTEMYLTERFERKSHIAILGPKSSTSKEMVKFFENICVNRGWFVKTFQDYDSAVKWLQQEPPQNTENDN